MQNYENPIEPSSINLVLSIYSCGASILSTIIAENTRSYIAWMIGITAGCFSIYASYMSIKNNSLNIKKTQDSLKDSKENQDTKNQKGRNN